MGIPDGLEWRVVPVGGCYDTLGYLNIPRGNVTPADVRTGR